MTMKKVQLPDTLKGTPISIWFDDVWVEYQVKVKGNKNATYHTTDKNDALATAQLMRNTIAYKCK